MSDASIIPPFDLLGGEAVVRRLAARFYERMASDEPALAALHELDADGKVHPRAQERFALFFIEWLGGPAVYSPVHGHPRLRLRHAGVRVDSAMRDAWMRAMCLAMDDLGVEGPVRDFLESRLAQVADFMRNTPDAPPS